MSSNGEIGASIRTLSGFDGMANVKYIFCTVTGINETERTCDVTTISNDGEMPLVGVNLMAEVDDGAVIYPAIDSTVLVSFSDKVAPFVIQWSELQKWLLIVGDSGIDITSDLIKLNDGSYGGLVKVIELTQKVNNLESLVNSLLTTLKATVIPLASSGTYPFAPLYASTNPLTPTQRADIESTFITHGKGI